MSRYEDIPSEVRAMLPSACDDVLTPEEAARLESVCNDDARVRLLVDYLQLDADLSILMQGDEALDRSLKMIGAASGTTGVGAPFLGSLGDTSPGGVGYFFQVGPLSYMIATFIMFVMGIAAWAWKLPDYTETAHVSPPGAERQFDDRPQMEFVGRITGMDGCEWADSPTAAFNGAHVPLGRKYALSAGLMEITYNTGAKVLLQGPVTYEVESRDGGFLSLGKLTAMVEKRAEGGGRKAENADAQPSPFRLPPSALFCVRTPTATVTDLGTEFGVEVAKSGTTSAYVFHGVIEVQPIAKNIQAVRLIENESAQVEILDNDKEPIVHRIAVDPASFVRPEKLVQVVQEAREKQKLAAFHRWEAYSQELRRDPSLMAYYDFQQKDGLPTLLPNVAGGDDRSLDGVVENVTWSDGRMVGKHALQFNSLSDYVQVNLPKEVDDLTLTAWVQVQSLNDNLIGLLMSSNWGQLGQIHWQLTDDGRVALDAYDTTGRPWIYKSDPVFGHERFYRWTHLAVVYDHAAGFIRFYADGKPNGEMKIAMITPLCIREARIGQWNSDGFNHWDGASRGFHGGIDEMAIFGRALSAEEIQSMFNSCVPRFLFPYRGGVL